MAPRRAGRALRGGGRLALQRRRAAHRPGPLAIAGNELDAAKDVRVEHFRYFWDDEGHLVTTTPFPAVDHGTLEFDEVGKKLGERVVGRFTVVFVTGDTLGGEFDAPVVEPDPDR